jgi:hypothetical protein
VIKEIDRSFGKHPVASLEHRYAWHQPEYAGLLTRAIAEGSMRRIAFPEWLQEKFPDWRL